MAPAAALTVDETPTIEITWVSVDVLRAAHTLRPIVGAAAWRCTCGYTGDDPDRHAGDRGLCGACLGSLAARSPILGECGFCGGTGRADAEVVTLEELVTLDELEQRAAAKRSPSHA